ncbi:MAG TPA: OmpA family protein [Rubrivivax sp.]|nr:OmpA family protein [Rubrivivax sp.]
MNDTDDTQRQALTLMVIIVGLVIAAVVTYGAMSALSSGRATATAAVPTAVDAPAEPGMIPPEMVYFAADSAALPAPSSDVLARVAEAARRSADSTVVLTPFFDPQVGGDTAARRGQERAFAVQHALEANGVPPHRIAIGTSEPAPMGDVRSSQSVEVSLR